jgi:alpha-beta hydrolase superfamily lysophospholipase
MRDQPFEVLGQYNAAFEPARTPYDWLSRDTDEVDRYVADPLCGDGNPLTYGYFADLFGVVADARDHLGEISCPLLVIAGAHDPAAGMGAHATALAEALRAAGRDVELTVYPEARHELLNETNRDDVTADIVGWLRSHQG